MNIIFLFTALLIFAQLGCGSTEENRKCESHHSDFEDLYPECKKQDKASSFFTAVDNAVKADTAAAYAITAVAIAAEAANSANQSKVLKADPRGVVVSCARVDSGGMEWPCQSIFIDSKEVKTGKAESISFQSTPFLILLRKERVYDLLFRLPGCASGFKAQNKKAGDVIYAKVTVECGSKN